MNHNEENNFKEYLKDTTPDLWAKIDSKLPSGMYTKDSSDKEHKTSDTSDDTEQDEPSSNKVIKFNPQKIYKIAAILAACMVLGFLAVYQYSDISPTNRLTKNTAARDINSNSSDSYAVNSNNDNTNLDADKNISEDNYNYESNVGDDNLNTESNSPTNNDITNKSEQDTINNNLTIKIKVTKQHTTDIGLVYEGVILETNSSTIKVEQTVYVSLRNLSRHDLLHTYTPNETFIVSIDDDSYTSTVNKPYFASKMN